MRKVTSAVPILWEDGAQLAVDDKQKRHVWKLALTGTLCSRLEKKEHSTHFYTILLS